MPSKVPAEADTHALCEQERNEIMLLEKMEDEQLA